MVRATFIGQAPGSKGNAGTPLDETSYSGRRLRRLIHPDALGDCQFVNLIDYYPGKGDANHPKGDRWPKAEGREAAIKMLVSGVLESTHLFMLGENVAEAFGVKGKPYFVTTECSLFRLVTFPHPSGVNRWWNIPGNEKKAKRFLRRMI